MKLGILSDNHGRLDPVRAALRLFDDARVDAIVHCGDLGGIETLEILAGRPLWFVWGNTDMPDPAWRPFTRRLGIAWPESVPVRFELAERHIAVCHGHETCFPEGAMRPPCDYLFHGHTHEIGDRRVGPTRIINPGALHRARTHTVAILDLVADRASWHDIPRS